MFLEEAGWLKRELARLDIPPNARVLDAPSSTKHFREVDEPHIARDVLAPLRDRGCEIVHVDIKEDPGVDYCVDLADPSVDLARLIGSFDLVLFTGLLEFIQPAKVREVCARMVSVTKPGGFLAITTPGQHRRTYDPVDYGFRPSVKQLIRQLPNDQTRVISSASVRIGQSDYYKGRGDGASEFPIAGRWVKLPGFTEHIRWRVPFLRWRETCVIVKKTGDLSAQE